MARTQFPAALGLTMLLCLALPDVHGQPPNNACASAAAVVNGTYSGTSTTTTVGATDDGQAGCGNADGGPDVWFVYAAPQNGTLTVDTCGTTSGYNTVLSVHTTCPGNVINTLACNNDSAQCGPLNTRSWVSVPVSCGSLYLIRVAGSNRATGAFTLGVNGPAIPPPPSNDSCASPLPVADGLTTFSTAGATGVSTVCSNRRDIWYRYQATGNGLVDVSLCGSSFDTVLAVFADSPQCPPASGELLACNDDSACGQESSLTFTSVASSFYRIRIGDGAGAGGCGQLRITAPPLNDGCGDAVTVVNGTYNGTTVAATADGASTCGGFADVWYRYTPLASGTLVVDTCVSSLDTVLSVHAQCPPNQPIACNDDACGRQSSVSVSVSGGSTYLIRVAASVFGVNGTFVLNVNGPPPPPPPPANDNCTNAITVGDGGTAFSVTNATPDGPPSCTGGVIPDTWYRYTSLCAGPIEVWPSTFATLLPRLTVYQADSCPPTNMVACNRGGLVTFIALAGATYLIQIGNENSPSPSNGFLFISPGNRCETAIEIGEGGTDFSNACAANHGPPTCVPMGSDLWYRYPARGNGLLTISTCATSFDTVLAVYGPVGSLPGVCSTLVELACDDDACAPGSSVTFRSEYQRFDYSYYLIRVGGKNGAQGTGTLRVQADHSCAAAEDVSAGGTFFDCAGSPSEGSSDCSSGGLESWFTFSARCNGTLHADTCIEGGGGVDTVLSLHSGCPGTIANQFACNDDAAIHCAGDTAPYVESALDWHMGAGEIVKIRVSKVPSVACGIRLNVLFTPALANNACGNSLSVTEGATAFCTLGATTDGPAGCGAGQDVWYRYTPSCTGTARIALCGSTFDSVLAVYTGSCGLLTLAPGACNDNDGPACPGTAASVDVPVTSGTEYKIRVGGAGTATGTGTMTISCTPTGGACCSGSICTQVAAAAACTGSGTAFVSGAMCTPYSPTVPCCRADFNRSGTLSVQDIFDFLAAYFAADPRADFNAGGTISVQDIFDFLAAYFAGC